MSRAPYPDPKLQAPDTVDLLSRIGNLNVTRMMSHAPGVMKAYSKLGSQLLMRGKLDPVLLEVLILRIGQLCGSAYEWHQHVSVARAVGMGEAMLEAIDKGELETLPPAYLAAVRVIEDIKQDSGASAASFSEAQKHFSPEDLVEICLVAGYYIMTAGFLGSFAIEIEDTPPLGASMKATPGG
jgi:hypothetical protein